MIELKFKRKTGWDGPDLDRGAERRAADLSLKILKNLEQVFLQAYETQTSPDWIYDLGGMDSQSAAFLLHSLGKLLFLQMLRHIDPIKINGIPFFQIREHDENSGQNHSGNGDNGPFLAPAFGNTLIFESVVRRMLVLHGCVSNLHQRRFEVDSRT